MTRAFAAAACLALASLRADAEPRTIRPGEEVRAFLPGEPGALLALDLESPGGPLTIEARSFDLDVRLSVLREGKEVAKDDDGLAGSDSRVVLASEPGPYRVVVSSSGDYDPAGEVAVLARSGEAPRADPEAQKEADEAYWSEAEARATASGNDAHLARAIEGRAALAYQAGRPSEARALASQALALAEGRWKAPDRHAGMIQGDLGIFLMLEGRLEEAEAMFLRSIASLEATVSADDERVATTLNGLGTVQSDLGDYRGAKESLERALAIREKVYGPTHTITATAINNLATVVEDMGRPEDALALYRRTLAIFESAHGPDHPRTASALNNIGHVLRRMRRYEEALPYYERALAIRQKRLGTDHPLYALSLQNLGTEMHALGRSERAIELLREALALREKRLGPDHPDVAVTLGNLAGVLHDLGRDAEALPLAERSLAIRRSRFGASSLAVARQLAQRARIVSRLGRPGEALLDSLEAEAIGRESLRTTVRYLPEHQALRYAAMRVGGLDAALDTASEAKEPIDLALLWDAAIRSRSLVLDEMATRVRSAALAGDGADPALRASLDRAVSRYTKALYGGDATAEEVEAARAEKDEAERALAAASASFREELRARDVGFEDVARALPPGGALVALARYDVPDQGAKEGRHAYAAFVLRAGSKAPSRVLLGDAKPIDRLAEDWRAAVSASASPDVELARSREEAARAKGARLRALVWDPVAKLVGDAEAIFLVPEGSLHLVPLGALPVDGTRYLVETTPRFHYLSAERDLVRLSGSATPGGRLLAIGGPAFDQATTEDEAGEGAVYRGATAACDGFRSLRFRSLPLAGREASDVAAAFRSAAGGEADLLTGARASEAAFKRLAPGSAWVHLATHGFVVNDRCGGDSTELPLHLSGLALAGANRRAAATGGEEDGILTAEEIASMDLSGVRWVALSACDTGVGPVENGEGVLGLRRAFAVAGARTLILALWRVDDRDARSYMRALYDARSTRGLDTPRAMREASLAVLRERRAKGLDTSPLHWGGFAAAGDWR